MGSKPILYGRPSGNGLTHRPSFAGQPFPEDRRWRIVPCNERRPNAPRIGVLRRIVWPAMESQSYGHTNRLCLDESFCSTTVPGRIAPRGIRPSYSKACCKPTCRRESSLPSNRRLRQALRTARSGNVSVKPTDVTVRQTKSVVAWARCAAVSNPAITLLKRARKSRTTP